MAGQTPSSQAIRRGLLRIAALQRSDGGFDGHTSPVLQPFSAAGSYGSPFATALVLSCLSSLEAPELKRKAAHFLLGQGSPQWTFNYWMRGSAEAQAKPYPDDLDDTFCALSALHLGDPRSLDGEALAHITKTLTQLEEKPGGPYRTWLVSSQAPAAWQDVDLAVNSNIAYFLSLQDIGLPGLIGMAETAIQQGNYSSPYYPGPLPAMYFMARWYRGTEKKKLAEDILALQSPDGSWQGSPLRTALAISSLMRVGTAGKDLRPSILYLLNNAWEAESFCLDPAQDGRAYYGGCEALTAAFCLEALALTKKPGQITPEKEAKVPARVTRRLLPFTSLNIKKLVGPRNLQEILSLPAAALKALPGAPTLPKGILEDIAAATLFGWIAYTIYDTFLDEGGDSRQLPLANLAQREMNRAFLSLVPELATDILDRIDLANAWETARCRCLPSAPLETLALPNYGDLTTLADRSLGHSLAVLSVLALAGCSSDDMRPVRHFFKHYLIAKQLDDDAHDWKEDLAHGQINAVAAKLLISAPGLEPGLCLNDPANQECLSQHFWTTEIITTSKEILSHTEKARKHLGEAPLETAFLERLLLPAEQAARKALAEHEKRTRFIAAYQG